MRQSKRCEVSLGTHDQNRTAVLECRSLTFAYGRELAPVLQEICFSLDERDAVFVLGPSGSGKSTLAYCLNGLYPDAVDGDLQGEIVLHGRELTQWKRTELSKQIGIVFQDPESQFVMTLVEDEIAFGLENISCPADEMRERIDHVLELTQLTEYRHTPIAHLSGGMKQRLALACVLALEPAMLILDEPTSQLDPATTREFVQLIRRIREQRPLTLFIIEHRVDVWMEVANQALVFDHEGSVIYQGELRACMATQLERLERGGMVVPTYAKLGQRWLESGIYQAPLFPLTMHELLAGVCDPAAALQDIKQMHGGIVHGSVQGKERRHGRDRLALPFVELKGVAYVRQEKPVLRAIDLSFYTGELVAVVGPNGAGKTTLAHVLTGLLREHAGEVLLQGRAMSTWEEQDLRKQIGLVFQNPEHQFITPTVADEIAFGLRVQGEEESSVQLRVKALLERFRLSGLAASNPFSLSQGQKRRLSVATMLVDEQQMLVLDEPTFGQDAYTSLQLMQLLRQLKQQGKGVVMMTHDMELVQAYADRVIVIVDGAVQYDGVPASLWENEAKWLEKAKLRRPVGVELMHLLKHRAGAQQLEGAK